MLTGKNIALRKQKKGKFFLTISWLFKKFVFQSTFECNSTKMLTLPVTAKYNILVIECNNPESNKKHVKKSKTLPSNFPLITINFSNCLLYSTEIISIVLKREEDSGTMPALALTQIIFGAQLKPLRCDISCGLIGKIITNP